MAIHLEKIHKASLCSVQSCDQTFVGQGRNRSHEEHIHTKHLGLGYFCSMCHKLFQHKNYIYRHLCDGGPGGQPIPESPNSDTSPSPATQGATKRKSTSPGGVVKKMKAEKNKKEKKAHKPQTQPHVGPLGGYVIPKKTVTSTVTSGALEAEAAAAPRQDQMSSRQGTSTDVSRFTPLTEVRSSPIRGSRFSPVGPSRSSRAAESLSFSLLDGICHCALITNLYVFAVFVCLSPPNWE